MEELTLDALLAKIKSDDAETRTDAWLHAGAIGAPAIMPLAAVIRESEPVIAEFSGDPKNPKLALAMETGRAAKRAMWKIVRVVGAPGQDAKKKAVVAELLGLIDPAQPDSIRREVLWMLSEIGGDETIEALRLYPELIQDEDVREDARCLVERIPTKEAVKALKQGLEMAPDDYKINVAQSLRVRGVKVDEKKYGSNFDHVFRKGKKKKKVKGTLRHPVMTGNV